MLLLHHALRKSYLFYLNMFVVVAQSASVVEIFFDVLALQFLQQVDDIAFRLAKWDVFGKHMKRASTRSCFRAEFERLPFAQRRKMSIFVKILYIINLGAMMTGLTILSVRQQRGEYNCNSITVSFDDHIWEKAIILNSTTGGYEERDLIYSYFNGVYKRSAETEDGRPVYIEQNKFDNSEYQGVGAKIRYCESEGAWVFMHDKIRKDKSTRDSDCPWLLRSAPTDSFNLLEVSGDWSIWTGMISAGAALQTTCNACKSEADCNYHGNCLEGECKCKESEVDGHWLYTGTHCEFPRPCVQLRGDKGDIWEIAMIDAHRPWTSYGRGVYKFVSGDLGGGARPEDALALMYTGARWFSTLFEGGECKGQDFWLRYSSEFHAFWDELHKEYTKAVSDPTSRVDPIAVDVYTVMEQGRRYGPLGKLMPVSDPPGSGYFECQVDSYASSADEVIAAIIKRQIKEPGICQ